MAEETQDSTVETAAPAAEAPMPSEASPVVAAETDAEPAVEATPGPVKARKPRLASAKKAKTVPVAASVPEVPVAKAAPVKVSRPAPARRSAEKALPKARVAKIPAVKAPVTSAPLPVVKPAAKRPFTTTPRVKQNSAAPEATTAPRKELFAMATTSTEITEKMTVAFKEAQEKAKAAMEKSQAAMGDVSEFAKGNVEAMVESTKILANGLQEMTKGYVAETKTVIETMTSDVKDLTTVTSPTEFFQKQSALMRKNFDAVVAASSKNSEAMLKLATEAFQPISTRVSLAVEKMKQAA